MLKFHIRYITGETYDCDDCGSYTPERTEVRVNHTQVWYFDTDNHLSSSRSEHDVLTGIIKECEAVLIKEIESNFTEKLRLKWHKQYTGNTVAKTVEEWNQWRDSQLTGCRDNISAWRDACASLPDDLNLAVKMIALWYEAIFGEEIKVRISSEEDLHFEEEE